MIKSLNPWIVHMSFEIKMSESEVISKVRSVPVSHSITMLLSSLSTC